MELKIYSQLGYLKATVSPSDSSVHTKEVMADNVVSLSFVSYEYVPLNVNDYIEFEGERFTLLNDYRPVKKSTVEYHYDCKFYGVEAILKKAIVLKLVDGEMNPQFSLTDTAAVHLQLMVDNINRITGRDVYRVGEVVTSTNIVIDYDGIYVYDGLNKLAEACGVEWWMEGYTLNLSRCEHGSMVELGYNNGLTELSKADNNNVKFFTRLIPLGSTRNIKKDAYGYSRLQLPGKEKYVEQNIELGISEHVEESYFKDIYPRRTGHVGEVRSENRTFEGEEQKVYYFSDPELSFDPNTYRLPGLKLNIVFQSGELDGYDFEVDFNSETKEFEIINKPVAENILPSGPLIPEAGDIYILYNLEMPTEYYGLAEAEYADAVRDFLEKNSKDVAVYKSKTDYIDLAERGITLTLGRRVKLCSTIYFPEGSRESRITRISRKLNNPGQAELDCSYAISKGRLDKIETSVADIKTAFKEQLNKDVLAVLKSWDSIDPSEYNVFSSLRTLREISSAIKALEVNTYKQYIRKDVDDIAKGQITFEKGLITLAGIRSGLFGEGYDDGFGFSIDKDGNAWLRDLYLRNNLFGFGKIGTPVFASGFTGWGTELDLGRSSAELDYLTVRKSMRIYELVVNQLRGSNGNFVVSDFNKLESVEDRGDVWRCYIDDYDGEMYQNMRVDDLIRCQVFDGNNTKYYKARVTAVSSDWYEIGKTMLDGIDIPEEGDVVCRWNNFTDTDRQGLIYLTSSDSKSPYIDILDGSPELSELERLRARIGRLDGIADPAFPDMRKYGIYTDSFYGKGELILHSSGKNLTTMFAAIEGRITAEVSEVRSLIPEQSENILRNASFGTDTFYWDYTNDGVKAYNIGGKLLFVSGGLFLLKEKMTEIIPDIQVSRRVLKIVDNTVIQWEKDFKKSTIESENDKYELSFTYKVTKAGSFKIGIPGTDLYVEKEVVESDWKTETLAGSWDQSGNFEITITGGEILIYNVSVKLSDKAYILDLIDALKVDYKAGLDITTQQAKLYADEKYTDLYGRVTSEYNAAISVSAQNIWIGITAVENNLSDFRTQTNTSISLLNGSIALKVSREEFSAIQNRMSLAESSIIQNQNQIAAKVSRTEFDSYQNVIASTYATTIWTSSLISNYVQKTDYNGNVVATLINQSADSVKISARHVAIQIGNFNQVRDSESLKTTNMTYDGCTKSLVSTTGPAGGVKEIANFVGNSSYYPTYIAFGNVVIDYYEEHTFSLYVRCLNANTEAHIGIGYSSKTVQLSPTWKRVFITADVVDNGRAYIQVQYPYANIQICMVQVEKSNLLTAWNPHPEDVASRIQSAMQAAVIDSRSGLGSLAWENMIEIAKLGSTIMEGGYLKTTLIDVVALRAQIITADYISALNVNFQQGYFGPFTISGQSLVNTGFSNDAGIIMRNDGAGVFAAIGGNVLPSSSGLRAVARFENNSTSGWFGSENYALVVKASGSSEWGGTFYRQRNHAIHIAAGWISGLSISVRQIDSNYNLTHSDVYVSCYNASRITVTLKSNPEVGKMYIIYDVNGAGITINGNGIQIHYSAGAKAATLNFANRGCAGMLIYDGQFWMWNLLNN